LGLFALLGDPGVEFVSLHHLDLETHDGMIEAAELRALGLEGTRLVGGNREPIVAPGDDVELVEKVADVEGMDDVRELKANSTGSPME
jgi:hypothetical protein